MDGACFAVLSADQRADDSADNCGAKGDHTGVMFAMVVVMMRHGRWRRWRGWRQMVVRRGRVMMHRRGAGVISSAMWSREAGSRERQAGEDRSEGFHGLVHNTPSLSSWFCCAHLALTYCKVCIGGFPDKLFYIFSGCFQKAMAHCSVFVCLRLESLRQIRLVENKSGAMPRIPSVLWNLGLWYNFRHQEGGRIWQVQCTIS